MTNGPGITNVSALIWVPSSSMISALSDSTKQIALRAGTIESGSKVAFSTSALLIADLSPSLSNSKHLELQSDGCCRHIEFASEISYKTGSVSAKRVTAATNFAGLGETTESQRQTKVSVSRELPKRSKHQISFAKQPP
jgi:hypothetical protein